MHLEQFAAIPSSWRNDALAEKWRKVRTVRRVVTGALEIERAAKRIGSSLEAAPMVYITNPQLFEAVVDVDLAEISITSAATLVETEGPADAFRLEDVAGVVHAHGRSCPASARSLASRTSRRATPMRCGNGMRRAAAPQYRVSRCGDR